MMLEGAAKRPCVLPAVLGSGSGMPMIEGNNFGASKKLWPDNLMVFPYKSELTVAMDHGRSTVFTQQA